MTDLDDEFRNPVRGYVRTFWWLSVAFALAAVPPLVLVALAWATGFRASDAATIAAILCGTFALTMAICAVATIFPARAADRALAAFRRGEWLVRWDLSPGLWAAHAEGESRRWRKTATIGILIIFGMLALVGVIIVVAVPKSPADKILGGGLVLLGLAAAGWLTRALVDWLIDRRVARLAGSAPRAYVGATAVYCGGVFNFWGSQLRGLHDCRVEPPESPGEPSRMVFEIGMSRGGQGAMRAAGVATVLSGRAAPGSAEQTSRQSIPIPPGQEDVAHALAAKLMRGAE